MSVDYTYMSSRIINVVVQIDEEPFNPEYTVADRVIDVANSTEPNGEV